MTATSNIIDGLRALPQDCVLVVQGGDVPAAAASARAVGRHDLVVVGRQWMSFGLLSSGSRGVDVSFIDLGDDDEYGDFEANAERAGWRTFWSTRLYGVDWWLAQEAIEAARWRSTAEPRLEALQALLEIAQGEAAAGRSASESLASERQANAMLTEEVERLKRDVEQLLEAANHESELSTRMMAERDACRDSCEAKADRIDRLGEAVADQRRTIDALMIGMPDDGTTPVIRRIAALESERDALKAAKADLIRQRDALQAAALKAIEIVARLDPKGVARWREDLHADRGGEKSNG